MDSPFEQYHEEALSDIDTKGILERVNRHIAPEPVVSLDKEKCDGAVSGDADSVKSVFVLGTLITVTTASLIIVIWLLLLIFVRNFHMKCLTRTGRMKNALD